MAIVSTSQTVRGGFLYSATSADASGCEEIVAAVAGKKIKLHQATIISGATITATLGAGETAGAVTNILVGPVPLIAGSMAQFVFSPALELPAATALVVDSSGAGNICIVVQGVIE